MNIASRAEADLEAACSSMKHFLTRKQIAADVFVMDRDENYPLIVLTPQNGNSIKDIRQALEIHDCACNGMEGVKFADILATLEEDGNKHWGVVLHASQYVVRNITDNLRENFIGVKNGAAPAVALS